VLISLIGQSGSDGSSERLFADIIPWIGLLAVIIVIGGLCAILIRRRMNAASVDSHLGYTLEDLRALRDSGKLTEEEFKAARLAMIQGISKQDEPV